ncbi:MAG: hypothetical protein CVT49_10405 [candidate division Zixibacteria bacterium HGW-Zixibacteria-1]|nr:MAG: hypothetical protein CVT49_10405 [candidate division Zixibacteria bacterium HGW-Zixibacteria-1]
MPNPCRQEHSKSIKIAFTHKSNLLSVPLISKLQIMGLSPTSQVKFHLHCLPSLFSVFFSIFYPIIIRKMKIANFADVPICPQKNGFWLAKTFK